MKSSSRHDGESTGKKPSKKIIREFSSGAIVLRRMRGQWFIAVIEPQNRYGLRNQGEERKVVALPKGGLDDGESAKQAALREVEEETGIKAGVVQKLAEVHYYYVRAWKDNARVSKTVRFYLCRYGSGRIGDIHRAMRREVARAFWLPLDEAPKRLSYGGEKTIVRKVQQLMQRSGDEWLQTSKR